MNHFPNEIVGHKNTVSWPYSFDHVSHLLKYFTPRDVLQLFLFAVFVICTPIYLFAIVTLLSLFVVERNCNVVTVLLAFDKRDMITTAEVDISLQGRVDNFAIAIQKNLEDRDLQGLQDLVDNADHRELWARGVMQIFDVLGPFLRYGHLHAIVSSG